QIANNVRAPTAPPERLMHAQENQEHRNHAAAIACILFSNLVYSDQLNAEYPPASGPCLSHTLNATLRATYTGCELAKWEYTTRWRCCLAIN
ncbi:MAG: hypothetical protein MK074_09340, partial [Phycisphaerales bacterium]|nr:hypothetical protein [Phycisphaerales bacterium]